MGNEAGRRRFGRLIPGRAEGAETCTSAGRCFPRWQSVNQHRSCAMGELARFGRNRGVFPSDLGRCVSRHLRSAGRHRESHFTSIGFLFGSGSPFLPALAATVR